MWIIFMMLAVASHDPVLAIGALAMLIAGNFVTTAE